MSFKLEFSTSNAAFADTLEAESEIARILEKIALQVREGVSHGAAIDVNGNMVGEWRWGADDDVDGDPETEEPAEIPDSFITGEARDSDGHQYLWAYDRERDIAAIDYGGEYVDITVAGEWSPGKDPGDASAFETENVWDHGKGERDSDHPWTQEAVARILMPHAGY